MHCKKYRFALQVEVRNGEWNLLKVHHVHRVRHQSQKNVSHFHLSGVCVRTSRNRRNVMAHASNTWSWNQHYKVIFAEARDDPSFMGYLL